MAISGCSGIFTHNEVLAIYNHWSQLFWHHWLCNDNAKSLVSSKTTTPQHSCFGVTVPNSINILGSVGFFIGGQQFSLTFPLEPPLIWGTVIHLGLHLFLTKDSICMIPHILVSLITKLLNISRDRTPIRLLTKCVHAHLFLFKGWGLGSNFFHPKRRLSISRCLQYKVRAGDETHPPKLQSILYFSHPPIPDILRATPEPREVLQ